jgi:hypothetical protein
MRWVYDDGGRSKSGLRRADYSAGDCVVRAISIATGEPYREVWEAMQAGMFGHAMVVPGSHKRRPSFRRAPDRGVAPEVYRPYLERRGWGYARIKGRLSPERLPSGRLVLETRNHLVAVIDGVIHDLDDCSRGLPYMQGYFARHIIGEGFRLVEEEARL